MWFPEARYTIFTGTNLPREYLLGLFRILFPTSRDGSKIPLYERAFAEATGAKQAFAFGSGRMALYSLLKALGLKAGDEIILPAYTCVVVPNAMIYQGIKPVYVDIDPITFNIDCRKVEAAITPKTKAIYAQNTFGVMCDIDSLQTIAQRHGIPVIEDAAHSLGSTLGNKKSGGITKAAFFSTDHSKVINTHLGGVVTTSDEDLAQKLRNLQSKTKPLGFLETKRILLSFLLENLTFRPSFYRIGRYLFSLLNRLGVLFYFRDELKTELPRNYPYPCLLTSAQAEIGISQLQELETNLAHRRQIAQWLESRLNWYQGTSRVGFERQAWLRYSFLVSDRRQFELRFAKTFELGTWFTSVVHGRNENLQAVGYQPGSCPIAEKVAAHIVNLPTHPKIPLSAIQKEWMTHEPWIKQNLLRLES